MKGALVKNSGESWVVTTDLKNRIVRKNPQQKDTVIFNEKVTSFDVIATQDETLHIFAVSEGGELKYIKCCGNEINQTVVNKAKDESNAINGIRVLYVQGRFHMFYCVKGIANYLVHQVLSEDGLYEPHMVDVVCNECVYNVISDCNWDIHIVYGNNQHNLNYVKYVYSLKKYMGSKSIVPLAFKNAELCICCDRLFVSYVKKEVTNFGIYITDVLNGISKRMVYPVPKDTELSLNTNEKDLILHFVQDGVCCEIKTDPGFSYRTEQRRGISKGIFKICTFYSGNGVNYPLNIWYRSMDDHNKIFPVSKIGDTGIKPLGNRAEIFAKSQKEFFNAPKAMAEQEDVWNSLVQAEAMFKKIGDNVERLLKAVETIAKENTIHANKGRSCTKISNDEYNETKEGGIDI